MQNSRIMSLRNKLDKMELDAVLITNFYNTLYLSNFKTLTTDEREAFVLLTTKNVYLFTDARYIDGSSEFNVQRSKLNIKLLEPQKGLISHLQDILKIEQIKSLGFEAEDIRFNEYQRLKETLKDVSFVPTNRLVITIREIKDQEEIDCIQKACEVGDTCLKDVAEFIREDVSEKEIAFKLELWLKEKGYGLAFDPIVAVDANSSLAHYNTKDGKGKVRKGSAILIDFGVKYKNYVSDISRMVFWGNPESDLVRTYELLLNAQEKAIEKLKSAEYLKEVDEYCRRLITDHRLPSYPHSTGHGVGLEIHEYPKVSFNSPDRKLAGQVFTVEPGIYFPGKWGMRIEDTVVIDHELKPKVLTKFSKSLQIL